MADAAKWVIACEGGLWPEGRFMAALDRNARAAMDRLIDRTPLAAAIAALVVEKGAWSGTMTQLLPILSRRVDEGTRKSRSWAQDPIRLGTMLRNELRPLLRELHIDLAEDRRVGHKRDRVVTLRHSPAPVVPDEGNASEERREGGEDT